MRLRDWVQQQGRGELTRIQAATGLAYSTVHHALDHAVRGSTAQKISEATGGAVSIEELCAPSASSPSSDPPPAPPSTSQGNAA